MAHIQEPQENVPPTGEAAERAQERPWGRVLIAGGTDWLALGGKKPVLLGTDLNEPHIIRSLYHLKIESIYTGHSAFHSVCVDSRGNAHFIGRNSHSCFGTSQDSKPSTKALEEFTVVAKHLKGASKTNRIVYAACGRHHTVLIGSDGKAWSAGWNTTAQCGQPTQEEEITEFTPISGPWEREGQKIVQASVGLTFSLLLTDAGFIYACGSSENGQLGNEKEGRRIVGPGRVVYDQQETPRQIRRFSPRKIVQIASGQQHSLAMDDAGYVWSWGFAGYGRLGHGSQENKLYPTMIPQYSGSNEATRALMITCGPACSVVVDRMRMYQIAGKWKQTGDGSSGAPYTRFKYIQELQGWKASAISSGGNTHFMLSVSTPDKPHETVTIGWGQNCSNSELGLGESYKNSTKPSRIAPLDGIEILSIAAGGNFTLFLARPSDEGPYTELGRWPGVESEDICLMCNEERDNEMPLECDRCDSPFHMSCLDPPLTEIPPGEWFCPDCMAEAEDLSDDDDDDDDVEDPTSGERAPLSYVKTTKDVDEDVVGSQRGGRGRGSRGGRGGRGRGRGRGGIASPTSRGTKRTNGTDGSATASASASKRGKTG